MTNITLLKIVGNIVFISERDGKELDYLGERIDLWFTLQKDNKLNWIQNTREGRGPAGPGTVLQLLSHGQGTP